MFLLCYFSDSCFHCLWDLYLTSGNQWSKGVLWHAVQLNFEHCIRAVLSLYSSALVDHTRWYLFQVILVESSLFLHHAWLFILFMFFFCKKTFLDYYYYPSCNFLNISDKLVTNFNWKLQHGSLSNESMFSFRILG